MFPGETLRLGWLGTGDSDLRDDGDKELWAGSALAGEAVPLLNEGIEEKDICRDYTRRGTLHYITLHYISLYHDFIKIIQ